MLRPTHAGIKKSDTAKLAQHTKSRQNPMNFDSLLFNFNNNNSLQKIQDGKFWVDQPMNYYIREFPKCGIFCGDIINYQLYHFFLYPRATFISQLFGQCHTLYLVSNCPCSYLSRLRINLFIRFVYYLELDPPSDCLNLIRQKKSILNCAVPFRVRSSQKILTLTNYMLVSV